MVDSYDAAFGGESMVGTIAKHLQGEPEWHDGHVLHEAMRQPEQK